MVTHAELYAFSLVIVSVAGLTISLVGLFVMLKKK